jgi:hypothetical protein
MGMPPVVHVLPIPLLKASTHAATTQGLLVDDGVVIFMPMMLFAQVSNVIGLKRVRQMILPF